jgi:hypothetical protein
MKHLLVSYVYTDALGNQKFHYKEIFVELSGGMSDIDTNKEMVQEVEKKTPRGSAILNITDLTTITKGPCVDNEARTLLRHLRNEYLYNVDEDGHPKDSLVALMALWESVNKYLDS